MGTQLAFAHARTLNQRQSDFVGRFVEHGDAHKAALEAGYAPATARTAGTEILQLPHIAAAVGRAVHKRLVSGAPLALRIVETLMKDETVSAKVRLDAAKTILDRAGYIAPKAKEGRSDTETPLHEMSTEELRAMAARLEHEIAGRAKLVSAVEYAVPDLVG
jgi:phage terminase small subunit